MNVEEETLRRIMREEIRSAGMVTHEALSSELDSRFGEFDKKMDAKLDAKLKAQDARIDARFDAFELNLAKFFGQTHKYFDARFNKFEQKFDKRFNNMQNSVDGIAKRLDDDIERAAMSVQLERHDTWVKELAQNTKTVLSTP